MIKIFAIFFCLVLSFCLSTPEIAFCESETEVEHIFTHCLIAYPEKAFSKNNNMRKDYLRDCITSSEFTKILNELFENNYMLVDINSTFKEQDGKIVKTKIKLPKGKKPLVMSFDDVNYDHRKLGKGMVDKLVVNNGKVVAQTEIDGKQILSNKEFVPLLDEFVKKNPSFSFNGAKGTLCLTGYDGVFGWRTQRKNKNCELEIAEAKKVANLLKANGWNFASHSYGHYHMKKISSEKFQEEINLWKDEVESIVGKTSVYVYPYGEWEICDDYGNFSTKHKMLQKAGFKLFCGVGSKQFFGYIPFKSNNQVLFQDRTVIDGTALKMHSKTLERLFLTSEVIDKHWRKEMI